MGQNYDIPSQEPIPNQMSAQDAQPFHWHYPDLDDKNFELRGRGLLVLLIVFAILLLLTLLFLYIRWVCRRSGTRPSGPSGPSSRQLSSLGLDPRVISSLPVLLHRQAADHNRRQGGGEEYSMCSICLSVFADGEKVKMLPKCGHTFHPDCVDEWLRTRSSCPMCRARIGEVPQGMEVDDGVV